MSEIKLLPCPFCGVEAEFYRMTTKQNFRWSDCVGVRCKTCGASCSTVLYDARIHPNDEEYYEAAKAWNTRNPMERIVERLREMKMRYFLTIANSGSANLDSVYEEVGNCIDRAIEIVMEEGGLC
jgi:Lar family restriction alleviation protein